MNISAKHPSMSAAQGLVPALLIAALLMLGGPRLQAAENPGVLPPHSSAYGKSLAGWLEVYWRWYVELGYNGNVTIPADANGNAVVGHNVVLMPLPDAPGDGTPGHLEATLSAGQAFVLPLLGLPGTSYNDGTPPDPFVSDSLLQTLDVALYVDGVEVVNSGNVADYYSKGVFDPAIPLPGLAEFGFEAVIWIQSVGIVHSPLHPGTHTLKLDIKNTEPFVEYHNTWTVTVLL